MQRKDDRVYIVAFSSRHRISFTTNSMFSLVSWRLSILPIYFYVLIRKACVLYGLHSKVLSLTMSLSAQ